MSIEIFALRVESVKDIDAWEVPCPWQIGSLVIEEDDERIGKHLRCAIHPAYATFWPLYVSAFVAKTAWNRRYPLVKLEVICLAESPEKLPQKPSPHPKGR